jgi:hypothetical protein
VLSPEIEDRDEVEVATGQICYYIFRFIYSNNFVSLEVFFSYLFSLINKLSWA